MRRVRLGFGGTIAVVALAMLFLLPAAGTAQPTAGAGRYGSALAAQAPTHFATSRMPTDLEKAIRVGTVTLGTASASLGATSASSFPLAPIDFVRPTGGPAAPGGVPTVQSASLGGAGGSVSAKGLNAFDSGQANVISGFGPLDVEPPDQGLCAGNGFVIDTVNLAVQVYSASSFTPASSVVPLAALVGFPIAQQFGVSHVGGGYILSDPRCLFDAGTGHWFISFLYLGGRDVFSRGGPFPLGPNVWGAEFVLASTGGSPTGSFNIYMIDVSSDPLAGNCPCFGDQPLLGADANTIILSTNEFPIFTGGFNGAQAYLFDKLAMAHGAPAANVAHFNIGLTVSPPDDGGIGCAASGGALCFYSVDPTVSPTALSYDTSHSGTAWAVSSLDFFGTGDNRLAVWSFSDTSSVRSSTPAITLSLDLMTGLESYASLGQLVPQRAGPIPLGDDVYSNTGTGGFGCVTTCTVGELASNGDGTQNAATYAQGAIWVAVSTVVATGPMGVAFWVVHAAGTSISLLTQGYISVGGASLLFPSVGAGPSGNAVVAFTLVGTTHFPSSAFAWISKTSTGPVGGTVFVSAPGKSPQDGFTEYQDIQNSFYRPRWGDYTFAVWSGGKVYFATEYIQSPNCSDSAFANDPTCGQTRDEFANWGTSLNSVSAS
jgi:hypothetical protein